MTVETLLRLLVTGLAVAGALRLLARMPARADMPPMARLVVAAAVVGGPLLLLDLAWPGGR